jgi:hypothetical protein
MEFAEWMAFYRLEPFGEQRADYRAALICKILADINTPKGKPRAKVSDFLLCFEREEQSDETMLMQVEIANAAYGGLDLREDDD